MAAVTKRVRFALGAVILPLHDPCRGGRGGCHPRPHLERPVQRDLRRGYVPGEFALFEKSIRDRAKLMDRGLEIILRALRGERFEIDGRPIFIRPLPARTPEDIIMVGGGVPASARRAARFGVGFGPMTAEVVDIYLDECRKLGKEPREYWRTQARHAARHPPLRECGSGLGCDRNANAVHVITEYAKWAEQEGDASNSPFKG
jgi:alkanesulfonate monooxygenase SsuD/methylene tetrahydromethanopterin reductase-like flavin-dependent oxidoreductase (luciferase family)